MSNMLTARRAILTHRRPRATPCFVGCTPISVTSSPPYRLVCPARCAPLRCALAPNAARVAAATLVVAGAVLRGHGIPHGSRLASACALAISAALLLRASAPRSTQTSSDESERFAGSRAMWADDEDEEESAPAQAPTRGLFRGAMDGARALLAAVVLPLLDAVRLLVSDIQTAMRSRSRAGSDPYFAKRPPRARRAGPSRSWSWAPPPPRSQNASKTQQIDDGLTEEERQIKMVGDAARQAAETARDGAKQAGKVFKSFLDGFK